MLAELGFRCDTSVRSGFDYRAGHGPDYRDAPLHPWRVRTPAGPLLEMPVTTVFGGLLGRVGQRFYHRIAREGTLTRALIARLGLVERIALTPEGIPAERACRRSEEHTSELQSLMRISYAVFCLKNKNTTN